MRVSYHVQRFSDPVWIGPNGRFHVSVDVNGVELEVTLDTVEVLGMLKFLAHSQLLDRAQPQPRDPPKRRLLGQHKALRVSTPVSHQTLDSNMLRNRLDPGPNDATSRMVPSTERLPRALTGRIQRLRRFLA